MFAVRSAIMTLGLVTWLTAPSGSSSALAAHREVAAFRLDPTIVRSAAFTLLRTSELTHYIPWKARPKMFMGESGNLPDEATSGPVLFARARVRPPRRSPPRLARPAFLSYGVEPVVLPAPLCAARRIASVRKRPRVTWRSTDMTPPRSAASDRSPT